jgi:hypothetical protein
MIWPIMSHTATNKMPIRDCIQIKDIAFSLSTGVTTAHGDRVQAKLVRLTIG